MQLEIAGEIVEHCLYVAPLQHWMLLVIDLIQEYIIKLPCGNG